MKFKKLLWWLFLAWPVILVGSMAVAAFCMAAASYHGHLFPDASTGHLYPITVGRRGGPYHTYYVSYAYIMTYYISRALFLLTIAVTLIAVIIAALIGSRKQSIEKRQD
jgi:hypothetical protein